MSHIVRVSTRIKCLEALRSAAIRCGLVLVEGKTRFRWYRPESDPSSACSHVLQVASNPQAWEIGVVHTGQDDQGVDEFELRYDPHMGARGLMEHVSDPVSDRGRGCDRLLHYYAHETALLEMQAQGFVVQEQELEDGRLQLVCTR